MKTFTNDYRNFTGWMGAPAAAGGIYQDGVVIAALTTVHVDDRRNIYLVKSPSPRDNMLD